MKLCRKLFSKTVILFLNNDCFMIKESACMSVGT